jgi:hypothetical protein
VEDRLRGAQRRWGFVRRSILPNAPIRLQIYQKAGGQGARGVARVGSPPPRHPARPASFSDALTGAARHRIAPPMAPTLFAASRCRSIARDVESGTLLKTSRLLARGVSGVIKRRLKSIVAIRRPRRVNSGAYIRSIVCVSRASDDREIKHLGAIVSLHRDSFARMNSLNCAGVHTAV